MKELKWPFQLRHSTQNREDKMETSLDLFNVGGIVLFSYFFILSKCYAPKPTLLFFTNGDTLDRPLELESVDRRIL